MFKRSHHQRIEKALRSLDAPLLRRNSCLFAGGTVIALRKGEYRESVDIDFLVSDIACYRSVRQILTAAQDINGIVADDVEPLTQAGELRADQYGIRCKLDVEGELIKLEIVLEGRIELAAPGKEDEVCGIATLTLGDMAASKLLANSDRWADDGVFSRDLIDLAMLDLGLKPLRKAVKKAEDAYGHSILRDLDKAISKLQSREGRLDRCMQAMKVDIPKALLWQKIRALRRVIT